MINKFKYYYIYLVSNVHSAVCKVDFINFTLFLCENN